MHDIICDMVFKKKIFWLTTTSVPRYVRSAYMIFWGTTSVTSWRITGVDRGCISGGHERVDYLTVPLLTPLVGRLLEDHR